MTDTIYIDLREWDAMRGKVMKTMTNPETMLARVGRRVQRGFREQFETAGQHWGTPWHAAGPQITRIRSDQGYAYNPLKPLQVTKRTMRSFVPFPLDGAWKNGVMIGSPFKHVINLHNGTVDNPGQWITFNVRSGGYTGIIRGRWWFIWPRNLLPINGLTPPEQTDIINIVATDANPL